MTEQSLRPTVDHLQLLIFWTNKRRLLSVKKRFYKHKLNSANVLRKWVSILIELTQSKSWIQMSCLLTILTCIILNYLKQMSLAETLRKHKSKTLLKVMTQRPLFWNQWIVLSNHLFTILVELMKKQGEKRNLLESRTYPRKTKINFTS